jgi:hypothetical protein
MDSRVAWVLPSDRLAALAASGFVIDEHSTTRMTGAAAVTDVKRGVITLAGTIQLSTHDFARNRTTQWSQALTSTVTSRNANLSGVPVSIESAASAELPAQPLCVGQSWKTHVRVDTTLGSGAAQFVHTVVSDDRGIVEVAVRGIGVIRGREYNLPRLLPGSIGLTGSFWYDASNGMVTQESYLVRARLLKTVRGKTIGFDETESVDVSTRIIDAP